MTENERTRLSKFLSLLLRHQPEIARLTLDENGWVDVELLLAGLHQQGHLVNRSDLEEVVATCKKQRFKFSDDGQRIRANQGHSVEVELGLAPQTPPATLFHGTARRFLDSIRMQGLIKGSRQHVHLSADLDTALKVGSRHGQAVALVVRAGEMAATGHLFYQSDNSVWLTEAVPAMFLDFSEAPTR